MAEDIHFREAEGRIYVEWRIWGFLENMFLKKSTYSYNPYIEITSPSFSLFNSIWHIQVTSSIYELWLKMRLCRVDSEQDLYVIPNKINSRTVGVPVSYKMGIETTFGDKNATGELEFSFENTCIGEWRKVFSNNDVGLYKKRQNYWTFAGFKDTAKVFCSFLLDPNSEAVEFSPQMPTSKGNTSLPDDPKEIYLCKSTMTSPEDFRDLYHSKGTLTSPEDSEDMRLIENSATLSENFKELYISKYHTDVTLKVKGKEFHAHRIVLVARSKAFASMFKHDTVENSSGIIEIPDCDPGCFEDFLLFLYSGKVDIVSAANAVNLYKTSDKYDIKELKVECVRCMARELTADSFCDVVRLAANHDEPELLTVAVNFFIANLDVILPTTKWQTFLERYPLLGNELFMKTVKPKK